MIVNVQHICIARLLHSNLRTNIMQSLRGVSTGKEPINNTHSSFEIRNAHARYMYTFKETRETKRDP